MCKYPHQKLPLAIHQFCLKNKNLVILCAVIQVNALGKQGGIEKGSVLKKNLLIGPLPRSNLVVWFELSLENGLLVGIVKTVV